MLLSSFRSIKPCPGIPCLGVDEPCPGCPQELLLAHSWKGIPPQLFFRVGGGQSRNQNVQFNMCWLKEISFAACSPHLCSTDTGGDRLQGQILRCFLPYNKSTSSYSSQGLRPPCTAYLNPCLAGRTWHSHNCSATTSTCLKAKQELCKSKLLHSSIDAPQKKLFKGLL